MNIKFNLQLTMKSLNRAKESVKLHEKLFINSVALYEKSKKLPKIDIDTRNKLMKRVDKHREDWWRELDKKVQLEVDVRKLQKQLLEEILEEK